MYPDPETFNPLRWLDPAYPTYKEPLTEYPTIINSSQFGYGRRLCQGQTVAYRDLLIGIAAIAWLFDIKKDSSSHGYTDLPLPSGEDVEKAPVVIEEPLLRKSQKAQSSGEAQNDPTLRFSHLLIAKPLPFEFDLTVRNQKRAELVWKEFSSRRQDGEFKSSRSYWGENEELGWGKV